MRDQKLNVNRQKRKRVAIIDIDFLNNKHNIPNIMAMKLSTFLKSKTITVVLIKEIEEFHHEYDDIYLFQTRESVISIPQFIYNHSFIHSSFLKTHKNYRKIPIHIAALRPDYKLYPSNILYDDYSFMLWSYEETPLLKTQNSEKFNTHKIGIFDFYFWSLPESFIVEQLRQYEHKIITFFMPFKLDILIKKPRVLKQLTKMKFNPAFPIQIVILTQEVEEIEFNFKILKRLRAKNSSVFSNIEIPIYDEITNEKELIKTLEKYLYISFLSYKYKVKFNFKFKGILNRYSKYLQLLENLNPKNHYCNLLIQEEMYKRKKKNYQILNTETYWNTSLCENLRVLLSLSPLAFYYALWTKKGLDRHIEKIDIEKMHKNAKRRKII